MKRFLTAAAVSVTLFAAGCSSDNEPTPQATSSSSSSSTTSSTAATIPTSSGVGSAAGFSSLLGAAAGGFDDLTQWQDQDGALSSGSTETGNSNTVLKIVIADGTSDANAPWNVNLQQNVSLESGASYSVKFNGRSDRARSINVGLGLNEDPWTNAKVSHALTAVWNTGGHYCVDIQANGFGNADETSTNTRLFFEFAGEDGLVMLDEIILVKEACNPTTPATPTLSQIDLPVNFEGSTTDYTVTDFGGAASGLIADPTDSSNMVMRTIKSDTAETWAGTTIGNSGNATAEQGFATAIPFTTTDTTISVKVYSPDAGIPVRFKVERADDNTITAETETLTTVANQWETMVFDINSVAAGTAAFDSTAGYDKASIFFNFDVGGSLAGEKTYYWDDVTFGGTATTPVTPPTVALPLDFELSSSSYTIGTFGGAAFAVEADPVDTSNNALKMTRANGTDWWSGGTVTLTTAVDATSGTYTMDVYSTSALDYVELKFEQDGNNHTIMTSTHGGTGWETLSFDTASGTVTGSPSAATLAVFTPRVTSDGSHTQTADEVYYIDNIQAGSAVVAPPSVALPLNFELASGSYTIGTFGGAAFVVEADPIDAGNNALKMTRADGTDWWSGGTVTLTTAVDATSGAFTMDVYSVTALAYVELKFEQDGSNHTIMTSTHGGTGWETLSFDTASGAVTGAPSAATLAVFTPRVTSDGSHTQSADEVYFIDNIQAAVPAITLPLGFELDSSVYTIGTFGGAAFAVEADPVDTSNNALKMTRANGTDWWSGGTVTLTTVVDATSGTYTMDVYSVTALGYVELKFEQDGGNHTIMTSTHGGTGWETLSFDTTSGTVTGSPSAATLAVFTPRVTSDGSHTQTADEVYYIDNIQVTAAP